jgi:hypothetical protein
MTFTENEQKKWTLKTQKSQIKILVLNQCSISAVFPIVRFTGDKKKRTNRGIPYIQNMSQAPSKCLFKWIKGDELDYFKK